MKLFLQKKMQNFRALGAPPPHPRASGGWGLCPQTPSLRQLGASPPDPHWPPAAGGSAPRPPKQPPPLRISGYAPGYFHSIKFERYQNGSYKYLMALPMGL